MREEIKGEWYKASLFFTVAFVKRALQISKFREIYYLVKAYHKTLCMLDTLTSETTFPPGLKEGHTSELHCEFVKIEIHKNVEDL